MKKKLSEMTLEELWQLFPIVLTPHRGEWDLWFNEEKALLENLLSPFSPLKITHIGSTAVPGIWAKPIVDILIETDGENALAGCAEILRRNGYLEMSREEGRISLNKGYTEDGFAEKVFHIHLRIRGDADEIIFRDALRRDPETAKAYEALKKSLWKKYEHDRNGYTEAKTAFIREVTERAKKGI